MKIKVRDLMTEKVLACRPADPLTVAAQIMWEHDLGCVPVLAEDADRVIAVITDRDLAMAVFLQGCRMAEIAVARAMSPDICWCGPNDTVEHVLRLMRERQIHRLPVLDDSKRLVGFISLNDIARKWASDEVPDTWGEKISVALAAIHAPRKEVTAPGQRRPDGPRPKSVAFPLLPRAVDDVARSS